jgi:hypothetical protein
MSTALNGRSADIGLDMHAIVNKKGRPHRSQFDPGVTRQGALLPNSAYCLGGRRSGQ